MSNQPKIVLADRGVAFSEQGRAVLRQAGVELLDAELQDGKQPLDVIREADALLVFWYPMNAEVINQLENCKVIVRNGVGVDNVDLAAAGARGIPVCNVPNYCVDEVADHAFALAMSLARQTCSLDKLVREGGWLPQLPYPIPSFGTMTFATLGLGRMARAILERAMPFHFKLAAYDPYVPDSAFEQLGARKLSLDEVFKQADILSLHSPLTPETQHIVNAERLATMKPTSIIINTSRGPLIDTEALADALHKGTIAAAGLDVFEVEPLQADHPIRSAPNTLLTPHFAWHSSESGGRLHEMAAAEAVRAVRGEPLESIVNRDSLKAAAESGNAQSSSLAGAAR